jgi:hypothetical protein
MQVGLSGFSQSYTEAIPVSVHAATAVHAEMLEQLEHRMLLNPKSQIYIF